MGFTPIRNTLDRRNRKELDAMLGELFDTITDLITKGKLTSEQFTEHIIALNSLIKKGDISVTDINKNKGKLDQTYMTDEFLQQIAGNAEINATPADGSISIEKLDNVLANYIMNIGDSFTKTNEEWVV